MGIFIEEKFKDVSRELFKAWLFGYLYIDKFINRKENPTILTYNEKIVDLKHKRMTAFFGILSIMVGLTTAVARNIIQNEFAVFALIISTFFITKIMLWHKESTFLINFYRLEIWYLTIKDLTPDQQTKQRYIKYLLIEDMSSKMSYLIYLIYFSLIIGWACLVFVKYIKI